MVALRTVADTIAGLPHPDVPRLPAPAYSGTSSRGVVLGTESVRYHTSNENWEALQGLSRAGYALAGHGLTFHETDVPTILERLPGVGIVVIQDRREWMGLTAGRSRDPEMRFQNITVLRDRPDLFKITVVKDAHSDLALHQQSAEEAGVHAWVAPYHPDIVCHLAPMLRPEHVIRTYHTVDASAVPPYSAANRDRCLLSGAVSGAYPLRQRLVRAAHHMPLVDVLSHPGYHRRGAVTPEYLKTLSRYKVAISTSSMYGYALRRHVEASACGCRVITDLPVDDVLPMIDDNLYRVPPDIGYREMNEVIARLCAEYDPERQEYYAIRAKTWYEWRAMGMRLAGDIETMRANYFQEISRG
jgi:hypothetical protein